MQKKGKIVSMVTNMLLTKHIFAYLKHNAACQERKKSNFAARYSLLINDVMKLKKTLCFVAILLAAVLNVQAATWEKPVPPECKPAAGQSYYLYNPYAEKFVGFSGVQATLDANGTPFVFTMLGSEWMMECSLGYLYADLDFVDCNGGASDSNTTWYIEQQGGGSYRIRPSKTDADFTWAQYPDMWMGLSYESWTLKPVLKADEGAIDWYIIAEANYSSFCSKLELYRVMTELQDGGYDVSALLAVYNNAAAGKAEYDAAIASIEDVLFDIRMQNASDEKPVDVTWKYMRNPDLTENWVNDGHDVPGWTMVPASFCGMGESDAVGFYADNKVLGSWAGGAFGDNKVFQQVEGLPEGKYKFSNYGIWIRHTGEDGDPVTGAYIYAKVGDKTFREPLPDTGWWRGLSEVTFETRSGEAEVGIMFEGTNVGQCVIYDFKLEFLGDKPVTERLTTLIANSQSLIDEGAIYSGYIYQLKADISKTNELLGGNDAEAQEAHFKTFLADYETAVKNKDAYIALTTLLQEAMTTLTIGESDEIFSLADYIDDNELQDKIATHEFDNAKIAEIMETLAELNDKAKNSAISAGADVTDLLVNGRFDGTGGWTATLNDFSIDSGKKIMERWWCDWKAEQVVENVPNGNYRLEVQGFQWCSWDWGQSENDWNGGDGSPTYKVNSKVRLNDSEVTIHNVFACGKTDITEGYKASDYYVPNDANTALKFFELGLYNNVVEATVTDHRIKIEFDCSSNGFWNCFKNLRLYFVGADMEEAVNNLKNAIAGADEKLQQKMEGSIRKALEEAKATGDALIADNQAKFDDVNDAATAILALIEQATVSIKEYARLSVALTNAEATLADSQVAATEAGQQLKSLYDSTLADYQTDYPTLETTAVGATIEQLETLMNEAKIGGGIKAGDDITGLLTNPSFENTYGNDISVGNAAHTVPYGWTMRIEGKECHSAQELTDAGINSWTAIEDNAFTTDGDHSYCLLSAPVPDAYLYQRVSGLPAGTYRVTVDMNVTYDGGCSRLTGQRLLVNDNAQYYGKPEYYIASELDNLHPEEKSRTFAGYDEVNTNETGASGDMGNMSTLAVEVTIGKDEVLEIGVRTDNNKVAMNRNYEDNWWDCTGRYKIDNFRLYCVSIDATGISEMKEMRDGENEKWVFDLQGRKISIPAKGIYIKNGKKYVK